MDRRRRRDGTPFTIPLDGSPIELDPGPHTFSFETAGSQAVTRTLVLSQGDRSRRERIAFSAAASGLEGARACANATSTGHA